ncbi:MAG: cupin domain-containing protein [Dehalococcoidia bacterium]
MGAFLMRRSGDYDQLPVLDAFACEGLSPQRWSNGAGDVYASHRHGYHKVLFCLRGSIVFTLTETSEAYELHEGDRLDIEPNTPHAAVVGPHGVTCVEAARE